jgi:hypothetical protein
MPDKTEASTLGSGVAVVVELTVNVPYVSSMGAVEGNVTCIKESLGAFMVKNAILPLASQVPLEQDGDVKTWMNMPIPPHSLGAAYEFAAAVKSNKNPSQLTGNEVKELVFVSKTKEPVG